MTFRPDLRATATALRDLPAGARVVAAPGCGTPETLLNALADGEATGVTLYSGLQLGAYPFLGAARAGALRYVTWHPLGPARRGVDDGYVSYVPARASAVPGLLAEWSTDVAFIRVSPPDRNGWCSLGPSASYVPTAIRRARLVFAEISPDVPRTCGSSMVHASQVTHWVESDLPMCGYPSPDPDPVSWEIARRVLELLPRDPVIQLGIGSVPEALTHHLGEVDLGHLRVVGMANDAMVRLFELGVLRHDDVGTAPAVVAAELMGTERLMSFCEGNPSVVMAESTTAHNPRFLAAHDRFVAINSAVEVDLHGQVNAEYVGSRLVSGVGGAADFIEGAHGSRGGLSIVALPATTPDGRHGRIVARLGSDTVSTARHTPDVVVTEHGVAWLRGRPVAERREALLEIADPAHRPV